MRLRPGVGILGVFRANGTCLAALSNANSLIGKRVLDFLLVLIELFR